MRSFFIIRLCIIICVRKFVNLYGYEKENMGYFCVKMDEKLIGGFFISFVFYFFINFYVFIFMKFWLFFGFRENNIGLLSKIFWLM